MVDGLTLIGVESHRLHTGWVGVWGWALYIFRFGQECVHEGVGVCAGLLFLISIFVQFIYLSISMCPFWQDLFQFSHNLIYVTF